MKRSKTKHCQDSWTRRHMRVEFVVSSRPCFEGFSPGTPYFPPSSKTNIFKFQFDLVFEGHRFVSHIRQLLGVNLAKQSRFYYFYLFKKKFYDG